MPRKNRKQASPVDPSTLYSAEPLSDAELEQKYMELASPVIGEERARALLARLWRLESEAVVAAIDE